MTREAAIKWKKEIEAFQEGKIIQFYVNELRCWEDAITPAFHYDDEYRIKLEPNEIVEYSKDGHLWFTEDEWTTPNCAYYTRTRIIKPESTKRLPTIEEVEKWFLENKVFRDQDGMLGRISTIDKDSSPIRIDGDYHTIKDFCEFYTHLDGSSLYITE